MAVSLGDAFKANATRVVIRSKKLSVPAPVPLELLKAPVPKKSENFFIDKRSPLHFFINMGV